MHSYSGKTAVVVGGTHGIGLAIARRLLEGDATVLVTGSRADTLAPLLASLGPRAHAQRVDLATLHDLAPLAERIRKDLGALDLLVVNAGVAALEPIAMVTEASYDRHFAINTKGAFFALQQLLPSVRDGGSIVLTSSVAESGGTPGMSVYSASKAALRSLASSFAAELLPRQIRVNVVAPGFIDTPTMGTAGLGAAERAAFSKLGDEITPLRRHGHADEVARAVTFLAFDATFTTGISLAVDGGLGQRLTMAPTEAP